MELLGVLGAMTLALLAIACSTLLAPRLGVAAPLLLVLLGVAVGLLPGASGIVIEPDWILEGLLPPLLYSAAVSMPTMNFRREFSAISGLSVILVIASSLILGLFFMLVLPGIGFAWGVALGAILSPTDAVAISMVRQHGAVSKRVVALLDGESLLNDATALVLLRTAIVATASAFSFWGAVGSFAYSVLLACVIGGAVGWLNLAVRARITHSAAHTVISFAVPFLASIPVEALGGSGLVAAVVAGLVTGVRAPRELSPRNRQSDSQNWRTVELVLEGVVFLTMGVQLQGIVRNVYEDHDSVFVALAIAAGAWVLTLVIRAAYVAPLLALLGRRARRAGRFKSRLEGLHEQVQSEGGAQQTIEQLKLHGRQGATERDVERFLLRVRRSLADLDYFLKQPLSWRDGTVVVWAGMRGAVTVAAAQSLPEDTPLRSVLVLLAFTVALLSLLVQGGSIAFVLRKLFSDGSVHADAASRVAQDVAEDSEEQRLLRLLREIAVRIPEPPRDVQVSRSEQFETVRTHRIQVIEAQRTAILDARDAGAFDADLLSRTLADLDASQIAIEMRATHVTGE